MRKTRNVLSPLTSARVALAFIACVSFCVWPQYIPGGSPAVNQEEMSWDKAESEVGTEQYPQRFIDSLRAVHGVGDNTRLGRPVKAPFAKSEKLVFDGGWGVLRAGFAILGAQRDTNPDLVNFTAKVVTNNFVSTFYKVRDYVHSLSDATGLYPLFFEQHVREGRYRDHRWTLYDHVNRKVYTHKKEAQTEPVTALAHNYLSLLYYVRTLGFSVGDTFSVNCFVHLKDYPVHFTVLRQEQLTTDAGIFNCLVVEPQLVGEGRGFTKKDQLQIWFTDDSLHMPVFVRAKINIGSLTAKLIRYDRE